MALGQGARPLRFGQLAAGAPILTQGVRGWLGEGNSIGFVAQLLEIADKRLEASCITAVGGQHAARICVKRARVFTLGLRSAPA